MKEKRTRMKVTRQREKRENCEICGGGGGLGGTRVGLF